MAKAKLKSLVYNQPVYDMSSADYHSTPDSYSSSQFKDLLIDDTVFIDKYIKKTTEKLEMAAFDIGTYFHTAILEPEKLNVDCAVYPGKIRRGDDWEKFKLKHANKAILTPAQKEQAEGLVLSVKNSPVSMEFIANKNSKTEVSLFVEICVLNGVIYAPHFAMMMTSVGWMSSDIIPKKDTKGSVWFNVKVRADLINFIDGYILDLKSTTGNARSEDSMRQKISYYQYDLSASMYLDMFSLVKNVDTFVWTFASKDMKNCRSHVASVKNILVGRAKYMKAFLKLAECIKNKWEIHDSLGVLEPLPYELEHIKTKDTDLL